MSQETDTGTQTGEAEAGAPTMSMDDFLSTGLETGGSPEGEGGAPSMEPPASPPQNENPSPPAEDQIDFGQVKIDGELQELKLPKEEAVEFIRMGKTFHQRMSEFDRDKKAWEAEKNKPLSEEEIQLRAQLSELSNLRSDDPEAYADLVNTINQRRIAEKRPSKSALDERLEKLTQLATENQDVPVLKEFVDTFAVMKSQLEESNQALQGRLQELGTNTDKVTQSIQTREQQEQADRIRQEAATVGTFLKESGVPEDVIAQKAPLVEKYHRPGMSIREVAEMVYAVDIATAKLTTPPPTDIPTQKRQTQPPPQLIPPEGSAVGGEATMSPDEEKRLLSEALFGKDYSKPVVGR